MLSLLHGFLVLVGTLAGVLIAYSLDDELLVWIRESTGYPPKVLMGILFGGVGYLSAATISGELEKWIEKRLPLISVVEVVWGTAGLVIGLVVANLFCVPILLFLNADHIQVLLKSNPLLSSLTLVVPLFFNILLGFAGITLFTRRQSELRLFLFPWSARRLGVTTKVLDTSAIIDGRVVEIATTRLLEGPVQVPRFVLHELQLVADSGDQVKRERGRRGFDNLERLKKLQGVDLTFPAEDVEGQSEVDAKLIAYCRDTGATLVTVDYNLNKLAAIQEIASVNINEVANALRPAVLAGDQVQVEVVKKGKDAGQGVGYLPDGSMVVVDEGASLVGQTAVVVVHKILQTSAGRMVFTRAPAPERASDAQRPLTVVGDAKSRPAS
ncbi:MAG: PIN domain nuclease [Candidatus Wallbacteria bacterium]|nr:PIN domain nuclease [Candidatus Wallbacteria bacterium]